MSEVRGIRKTRVGVVISDKMDKTCVVSLSTRVRHPLYGKFITRTSKIKDAVPCPRISVGGWWKSSKRPSKQSLKRFRTAPCHFSGRSSRSAGLDVALLRRRPLSRKSHPESEA